MLAGFSHAASVLKPYFQGVPKEGPPTRPDWGSVVPQFRSWAEGIPEVERPPKLTVKPTAQSSTKKKKTPASVFYAVAVGRVPGIYVSVDLARAQTDSFSKPLWKRCRSREEAEEYIKANTKLSLPKTTPAASSKKYKRVKGKKSESPARKSARKELFAEAQHTSDVGGPTQFFAVYSGAARGVYETFAEVSQAVSDGGGTYVVCASEDEAWARIEAAAADEYAEAMESEAEPAAESYVVWAGRQVGVMSLQACIQATRDLVGIKMLGPLSPSEASAKWEQYRTEAKILTSVDAGTHVAEIEASRPVTPAQSTTPSAAKSTATALPVGAIDTPSDAALALALQNGTSKVWAAVRRPMKGVISLSKHAIEGFASPKVFDVSSSVIDNVVYAERWLTKQLTAPAESIADKLAAARARIATENAASSAQPTATPAKAPGKHSGKLKGRFGLQRSREAAQIARIFLDDAEPIRILEAPASLHAYELMPIALPSTPLFGKTSKALGMKEYFKAVSGKSGDFSWPLMDLSPFLSFCRRAIDTCRGSSSEIAPASILALDKLSEIAIRVHDMMFRAKTLGDNNMRFQVRMYMHLEYMSETGTLHVGPQAMVTFRDAIDVFGMKVPGFVVDLTGGLVCTPVAASPTKGASASKGKKTARFRSSGNKPKFGCWLCPSMDHYVTKESHPTREKLSDVMKSSILTRIDYCKQFPEAEREAEKKRVREYWVKHKL